MFGPRRKIRYKIFKRWETCSRMEYYLRSPVQVLNSQGKTVGDNEMGSLAVKLPLPPGAMSMMWRNDEKFVRTYFTKFPVEYCHCVLELR
jgi:acyl-coenzyme A synthetase/AMP-(fatty) acid ligase